MINEMLEDFLKEKIYIKITNEDLNSLDELGEVLPVCFLNGDKVNKEATSKPLIMYNAIYIHTNSPRSDPNNVVSFTSVMPHKNYVTVNEFLDSVSKPFAVTENEIDELLT